MSRKTTAASAAGTQLSIQNLSKSFGTLQVLRDVDLEVVPGEFVAIVGRSGCGKSTLLRLLAGLETPTQGEILLDGHPLRGFNADARVMFQDSRLLPWRRVLDNVALGLKQNGKEHGLWALQQVG
jgi:sulfonate transport system ATP-binding protein